MQEKVDFLILGTGLAETMLAAILTEKGYKVMVIDSNSSYGSEFTTVSYEELVKSDLFTIKKKVSDEDFSGISREFNIDLIPKLLLMESELKDVFIEKQIDELVGFSPIKGSYFYSDKLHPVPKNERSALSCGAIGFMQKTKVARFFYNLRNLKATKKTMKEEFEYFGLEKDSVDFIGHGIALHLSDDYLYERPIITYNRIIRYIQSIVSYNNSESPFIYPQYGLSDICQGFVRKASCLGCVFMLGANITEINKQKVKVIDPNKQEIEIDFMHLITDPSYISKKVTKKIIRSVLICKKTGKGSRSVVFLHSKFNRKNDVFAVILDSETKACPDGYEIVILSTVKETDDIEKEISIFIKKFNVIEYYIGERDLYENMSNDYFVTRNVDESSLMDNIYEDVKRIIKEIEKVSDRKDLQ